MNYQNLSYITAFVIGLGFYFILQKSIKAKLFYIIMIILLIPVILISSGRGGAVLLILYILLTSVKIMTDKQISTLKKNHIRRNDPIVYCHVLEFSVCDR